MVDRDDAKLMARSLRREMAARDVALTHSECLEMIARIVGEADWNTLSAHLDKAFVRDRARQVSQPVEMHWTDLAKPLYERHFTREDVMVPAVVRRAKWQALFDEANRLYASGVEGGSAEIADLARRWIDRSWETSGRDFEYKRKSARVYQEALDDPAIAPKLPLSREVLAFLEKPLERAARERLQVDADD